MSAPKKLMTGAAVCALLMGLSLLGGLAGRHTGRGAIAAGTPSAQPLQLSLYLTDDKGLPLNGTYVIKNELYTQASGGTPVADGTWTSAKVVHGHYRSYLTNKFHDAVKAHGDLWLETTVNTKSLGRQRIGALPYALEVSLAPNRGPCPPGYNQAKITGYTVCKRGVDEVVRVGSYWVDRYEAVVMDAAGYADGWCDGVGKQYGAKVDDHGADFPDNGAWIKPRYACSVAGKTPSRHVTWFQAQQACVNAGKHLCTNAQWQGAATVTPGSGSCNISKKVAAPAGYHTSCISSWGAMDMVGNLWEWVDWWDQAGKRWQTKNTAEVSPWPTGTGQAYGLDKTLGINGTALTGASSWAPGMPAAAMRGGNASEGNAAGVFSVNLRNGPVTSGDLLGFRCCID